MTPAERQAKIVQHLGVARQMGEAASDFATEFKIWAEEIQSLQPEEEFRLIAEIQRQLSDRLVHLAGGR